MSTTYKTISGDTFELIARKQYGDENLASIISQANPGATEPLIEGLDLIIPTNIETPENKTQGGTGGVDEVSILIDGKRFRYWTSVKINTSIDSITTVEMSAPFEPDRPGFKETFRPFSYKDVEITVQGLPLFKGTMVSVLPTVADNKTMQISAYSTPGVLNDCTAPASSYPVEYSNQNLERITKSLLKPFGLKAVFKDDAGAVFEQVGIKSNQKILAFLSELAKQRNLVISSSEKGELIFQKSIESGTPVAKLKQGYSPMISITPIFNPQEYYSHITGLESVTIGLSGGVYTVKNGRLKNLLRPFTFEATDSESGKLRQAVEAKAGRMFGNMVSYRVKVDTWRDPAGNLWKPNTLVNIQSNSAMIYSEYNLLIRSVDFNRDNNSLSATLDLVIPGSFSGKIPEVLPWD